MISAVSYPHMDEMEQSRLTHDLKRKAAGKRPDEADSEEEIKKFAEFVFGGGR